MTRTRSIVVGLTSAMLGAAVVAPAAAPCTQWDVSGQWELVQSNGPVVKMDLKQSGTALTGTAVFDAEGGKGLFGEFGGPLSGNVEGTVTGGSLKFTVRWERGLTGEYVGGVDEVKGGMRGRTRNAADPSSKATWTSNRSAVCASVRPPAADQPLDQVPRKDAQGRPIKVFGKSSWTATAKDDVDIYDGPGGEFKVVGMLDAGKSAPILGQKDDWYQLKIDGVPGGSGWVAGDHLTTVLVRR